LGAVLAAFLSACRPGPAGPGPEEIRAALAAPDDVYVELRQRALRSTPADHGLEGAEAGQAVWGMVVDHGLPNGTATLVAFAQGGASLYLSSGGGLAGANSNAAVQVAASNFVALASQHVGSGFTAESWPVPAAGEVAFWFLVGEKVVGVRAPDKDLRAGTHPLAPLYQSANAVLTRLHLAASELTPLPDTNQPPVSTDAQPAP